MIKKRAVWTYKTCSLFTYHYLDLAAICRYPRVQGVRGFGGRWWVGEVFRKSRPGRRGWGGRERASPNWNAEADSDHVQKRGGRWGGKIKQQQKELRNATDRFLVLRNSQSITHVLYVQKPIAASGFFFLLFFFCSFLTSEVLRHRSRTHKLLQSGTSPGVK